MSSSAGVVGLAILALGILACRVCWRKLDQANELVLDDILRINLEKPDADLDSDTTFMSHKDRMAGWLILLALSLLLIIIGAGLALRAFT